ncbi:unnamed protein product [Chilo suppressalis]|uniref:Dystrophin n=1 Tax=Chilo suppressalis TaxID=168631 RepID=A0ABN8B2Q6_CHISP|nr:unnamed protein product [Chilo suppressalis]
MKPLRRGASWSSDENGVTAQIISLWFNNTATGSDKLHANPRGWEFMTVTALREHWDEANARVLQRKAQLDAMLGDSQRYEARRRDADAIIARGKALNSAVSSLQNFDRSLEKFVAWLSEAESLLDAADRDPHLLKVSSSPCVGKR